MLFVRTKYLGLDAVRFSNDFSCNTGCAKINYALLTGHDKSYTAPILKIYELIFSYDPQQDESIFFLLIFHSSSCRAISEFLKTFDF